MTSKDYIKLAMALAEVRPSGGEGLVNASMYSMWEVDRASIAKALLADNPRFDIARFLIATEK